jgi:hypothetical protein
MAKKTETALETVPTPGALVEFEYGDDAGKGFEHQTKADSQIPFIVLLQALSPMVVDEKAKAGQWYNTVTEQLYDRDDGFLFVPATTRNFFGEWTPRKDGGGYHGNHEIDSEIVAKAIASSKRFGKYLIDAEVEDKDGNIKHEIHQLVETFYVYGAVCSEGGEAESMAVLSFKSTGIRPYKSWMTRMRQFQVNTPKGKVKPPMYAHLNRITSFLDEKNGNKFYVPKISSADERGIVQSLLKPSDERFMMAKACMELLDSGAAKIDYSKAGGEDSAEEGDTSFP